jgi:hypothetical protein
MELVGLVAALVAFTLLFTAGVGHALFPRRTLAELGEHRLWPRPLVPLTYALMTTAELAVGGGGLALVAGGSPRWLTVPGKVGAVVLYVAFTAYSLVLIRWRPGVACACQARRRRVSGWTAARALILSGLSLAAFLQTSTTTVYRDGALRAAVTLLAAVAFAVLIWRLPDAMMQQVGAP